MKTSVFIIFTICCFFYSKTNAQEITNPPGLDKFTGSWQYINGQDTITMRCFSKYIGNDYIKIKALFFSYTYKKGNTTIWNNFANFFDAKKSDYGGTRPEGTRFDTLEIIGKDNITRRSDVGFLIINSTDDQLKYVRDLNIRGGTGNIIMPGEPLLPGFTWPSLIIFHKIPNPPPPTES